MSGSFIYRHHVEPRVALYSPREESFPIPLKYIDVTRTTHTNLDVKLEKRIDDFGLMAHVKATREAIYIDDYMARVMEVGTLMALDGRQLLLLLVW